MVALKRAWAWLMVPPPLGDERHLRRATLQLRIVRFLLASIPVVFALSMLGPNNTLGPNLAVYLPLTLLLLGVVAFVQRGWFDVAGWMISSIIWLFVTAATVAFGGLPANNAAAYVIVVMVAGAALGPRPAAFFAVLSALAAGAIAWAELAGLLPAPLVPVTLLNAWISVTITFLLAAVLHNLSIRDLDGALTAASQAFARQQKTQWENETRGLHGAALAQLAERALLVPDAKTFCQEAASVAASLLSVEFVFLVEVSAEGEASLVGLHGRDAVGTSIAVAGTPLAEVPVCALRLDVADLRALIERLGAGPVGGGLLVPVRGRSNGRGFLGVATDGPRTFTRAEEQFLGTLASLIGTLFEREVATDRAQRAQQFEVLGRLASGVAHDYNNLLTVIMGTSDVLRSEMSAARRASLVDDLDHAAESARLLTRQLMAFSGKQVITIGRLDLAAHVGDMFAMMRRLVGDSYVLDVVVPPSPVYVDADRGSIDQIVFNLLVNARDAMPDGGTIEIVVEAPGDGVVLLQVRDDGVGMDAATQGRMFQPFFTTKPQGTGLGLATVADIVRRHGATIDVATTLGDGATFTVRFPEARAECGTVGAKEPDGERHGRVLLAEDHSLVRAGTTQMLHSLGYDVVGVGSGREARDRLLKDHNFVILVTDVSMPDGDGRQLVQELFLDGHKLPVLFISGYTEEGPASPMGVSGFLAKPFTREELRVALLTCLSASEPV